VQLVEARKLASSGSSGLPAADATDGATHALGAGDGPADLSAFGVDEIRWLMHWLRSQLSQYFGDVRYLLGDEKGHAESLVASQQVKRSRRLKCDNKHMLLLFQAIIVPMVS